MIYNLTINDIIASCLWIFVSFIIVLIIFFPIFNIIIIYYSFLFFFILLLYYYLFHFDRYVIICSLRGTFRRGARVSEYSFFFYSDIPIIDKILI